MTATLKLFYLDAILGGLRLDPDVLVRWLLSWLLDKWSEAEEWMGTGSWDPPEEEEGEGVRDFVRGEEEDGGNRAWPCLEGLAMDEDRDLISEDVGTGSAAPL